MGVLDLAGVYAKIARAEEHGRTLNGEIRAWIDSKPYVLAPKVNEQHTRWSSVFSEVRQPDSQRWALIVGDFANNLRAALDHLFFAIAERYAPGFDVEHRTFPIAQNDRRFEKFVSKRSGYNIPSCVWAAIEREQPHNRKDPLDPSRLDILSRLAIIDKHHMLAVLFTSGETARWSNMDAGKPFRFEVNRSLFLGIARIEDGAEISWLTVTEPSPDMDPKFQMSLLVMIGSAPGVPLIEFGTAVGALPSEVAAVVERVSSAVT